MNFAFALALFTLTAFAGAALKTQTVEYKDGDTILKGYLAYDDSITDKRPGILVVPEWWGLTDYVKGRAEQLAKLGYVAFAADIYGEGFTTSDPKVAGEKMTAAVKNGWRRSRGRLALNELRDQPHVDAANLAAIGYCFGGGVVLEIVRQVSDTKGLKGVVSFHGSLQTDKPAKQGEANAKVLICHGDADPMVPMAQVDSAKKEFQDAGADVKAIIYPGAKHAFTNPNADKFGIAGIAYNKEADMKSWDDMKAFFAEIFGSANPKPAS